MFRILSKLLQLAVLTISVVATVATSGVESPRTPQPPDFRPSRVNGIIEVPANSPLVIDSRSSLITDVSVRQDGDDIQLPFERLDDWHSSIWYLVDIDDLPFEEDIALTVVRRGYLGPTLSTEIRLRRLSTEDVTPPTIGLATIEQRLDVDDQPEPGYPVPLCKLTMITNVGEVADNFGAGLVYTYLNDEPYSFVVGMDEQQTRYGGASNENGPLPTIERCYHFVATDLAGNETATEPVCFGPDPQQEERCE